MMKKRMRKLVAVILTAAMTMSVGMPAFAAEKESIKFADSKVVTKETDIYFHWQKSTDSELLAEGYSVDNIEEIREFSLENAFLERAKLTDNELRAKGYTEEEITILKEYDGGTINENSAVLLAAAECEGSISKGDYTGNNAKGSIKYSWTWDHEPLVALTDKAVVAWAAYRATDNMECYVEPVSSKSYAKISLYSTATGNFVREESVDLTIKKMSCTADADIPVNTSGYWTKSGKIHLYFDTSEELISKMEFSGALGHRTLTFTGGITFTVGQGLSITFTPSVQVTRCGTVYAEAIASANSYVVVETGN